MKFNGKHIAITAGLGAVLALSPVVGPVGTAFANNAGAEAASDQAASGKVTVYADGANCGEWDMPASAAMVSDNAKNSWAPAGQEFSGLWTVAWKDGGTSTGKSFDELAGNWAGVKSITAEYKAAEQGGEQGGQTEDKAQTITYMLVDDEGNVIDDNATCVEGESLIKTMSGSYDSSKWGDTLMAPQKDGYTFLGWTYEGYSKYLDKDAVASTSTVTTLVAHFAKNSDPVSEFVTVHLVDSDGTPIRDVYVQRNTSNWSGVLTNPTKEGYVFQGWQQEGASDVVTDLDSLVMAVDDSVDELTFKAVWKEAEPESRYVTVNYYDGDQLIGTGAVLNGTNQWSGTTTPSKDGYTFLGWQFEGETTVTPDLSKVVYTADEQVTEINLYAQWQKDEQPAPEQRYITVNYYDGDTLLGTGAVLNGTSDWSGIVNPTKDGYTFAGWQFEGEDAIYTDAELDNVVYTADEQVTEINLYAQWNKVPESARYITVHFYDDFGNYLGDGAVLNGTSDWSGPIDAPEVDGYTFLGWAEEGGTVYAPELLGNVVVAVPDDVTELTYIAHYQKTPAAQIHKVTFDDCLPSTTNQVVEVEDGKTVAKPADPVCAGWTFLGWYSDTALTQEYDFNAPVTADMTLYAKWQQNETTTGDTTDEGTDNGTTAETPTTPAKEAKDAKAMPQTGDFAGIATAVTGIAGASLAGIGAFLGKKRRK